MLNFKNKKVVIMGLGINKKGSGIVSAIFFARNGAEVLVTDMKSQKFFIAQIKQLSKYKNISFIFGKHRKLDFQKADYIIKNPDVPKSSLYLKIARENNIPIYDDWGIFLQMYDNPIIGITGTKGKSTTTTLIYEMLQKKKKIHLCGNIGLSPLALVRTIRKYDLLVAELSSFSLQGFCMAKKSPHISVITNLMQDHLNKYKNIKEYYKDKECIFKYQSKDDYLIVNKDDKELIKRTKKAKSHIFLFSQKSFIGDGAYIKNEIIFFQNNKKEISICKVKDIALIGKHNIANALAAICVAFLVGANVKEVRNVLHNFTGVNERLELVREVGGIRYYNDTTATAPDATIVALETFSKKNIILLAGGADKNLAYKEFARYIKKHNPKLILFIGTATDKIQKELMQLKFKNTLGVVSSMKDAMSLVHMHAQETGIVLLSPGAASFGIFKNEFDRGKQFCRLVQGM